MKTIRSLFFPARLILLLTAASSIAPAQTYSVVASFANQLPFLPAVGAAAAQARDGKYYGTTVEGGTSGLGTVFSVTASGTLTTVYSFDGSVGQYPFGGLTLGSDGNLYGTTNRGGIGGGNNGSVYKITTAGVITTLHTFANTGDGANPSSAPIQASDGNYYGTTSGVNVSTTVANSTIYKITSSGVFSTVHTLTPAEGSNVSGSLVQGTDGALYGAASTGGNGFGTLFKVTTNGAFTLLHTFGNAPDGSSPNGSLVQATNGNFYGTTFNGGTNGLGTIFQLRAAGAVTILHSFVSADGNFPEAGLVQGTDDKLYGTTFQGGTGGGVLFKITTAGALTVLWDFTSNGSQFGSNPATSLIQATNGLLYGSTENPNGGVFYSFDNHLIANAKLQTSAGKIGAKIGILGQGFSSSTVVKFGGVQATNVTHTATYLIATVPPGALTGTVTAATGATTLTTINKFQVKPTQTGFTPPSGPVGSTVTINGTGLTQTAAVTFNGLAATTFTVVSDTEVMATVPVGATTGKIKVTTPGGSASSATSFVVN